MDFERKPVSITMGNHINISLSEIEKGEKTFIMADGGRLTFNIVDVNDSNREQLIKKNIYKKAHPRA